MSALLRLCTVALIAFTAACGPQTWHRFPQIRWRSALQVQKVRHLTFTQHHLDQKILVMNQVGARTNQPASQGGIKKPKSLKCDAPLRGIEVTCCDGCEKKIPMQKHLSFQSDMAPEDPTTIQFAGTICKYNF